MSLSSRQLVEIRRRTRVELLEAGVIDLKDIFSKEDIKLMESVRFEARHLVSKINRVTLLNEEASGIVPSTIRDTATGGEGASGGGGGDADSDSGVEEKNENESLIEKLFIKFTKKILLFVLKLLREYVGGGAKIGSAISTYAFEKTILRVLKFLGLSDESAKKAKDFVSELVYHFIDLFAHGKTLDLAISVIEGAKPEEFEEVGKKAVKMAKEKMKKDDPPATGTAGSPAAETSLAAAPGGGGGGGATSESLNRLNKEIVILERRFRNQKRIR
jgi:hypothetical protein